MFISDPDFYPSRIQRQKQKEEGRKIVVLPFFADKKNVTKFEIFYFRTGTESNLSQLTKNYITFNPKNCQ